MVGGFGSVDCHAPCGDQRSLFHSRHAHTRTPHQQSYRRHRGRRQGGSAPGLRAGSDAAATGTCTHRDTFSLSTHTLTQLHTHAHTHMQPPFSHIHSYTHTHSHIHTLTHTRQGAFFDFATEWARTHEYTGQGVHTDDPLVTEEVYDQFRRYVAQQVRGSGQGGIQTCVRSSTPMHTHIQDAHPTRPPHSHTQCPKHTLTYIGGPRRPEARPPLRQVAGAPGPSL